MSLFTRPIFFKSMLLWVTFMVLSSVGLARAEDAKGRTIVSHLDHC